MLEVEYKALIDEETFERVRAHFNWDSAKHQINHYYYDEAGELGRRHITFRIREKDGRFVIQTKRHKNPGEALAVSEEAEFPADGVPESISARKGREYTGLPTGELHLLGSLDTLRRSLMWADGVEICLDRSEYLDRADYEIEVEYTGEFPDALREELAGLGVVFDERSVGKYTRFIRRFMELMRGNGE